MYRAPDPDGVVATLTDAFHRDPVMAWIFEDESERPRHLDAFWRFQVDHAPPTARILTSDGLEAVAIWRAPVRAEPAGEGMSPFVELMIGLLGETAAYEKLTALSAVGEAHPHTPHWYLPAVGTRTDQQGGGFGPKVITPMLDVCDAGGVPAYLESSNPRNIGFYERLGFVATGELVIGGDGPLMTFMWRDPAPPASNPNPS